MANNHLVGRQRRVLLSTAIDDADPDPRTVVDVLDRHFSRRSSGRRLAIARDHGGVHGSRASVTSDSWWLHLAQQRVSDGMRASGWAVSYLDVSTATIRTEIPGVDRTVLAAPWTRRERPATVLLMRAIGSMRAVVLDCPDPRALAEFYRSLVGGEITYADDGWVNLRDGGNVLLSFQRAPDYQAPDWPSTEHGQQFHIDVTVDDVDQAEQQVLAIGARRTELQPGIGEASNWRVYFDPVAHPFCLCWD